MSESDRSSFEWSQNIENILKMCIVMCEKLICCRKAFCTGKVIDMSYEIVQVDVLDLTEMNSMWWIRFSEGQINIK